MHRHTFLAGFVCFLACVLRVPEAAAQIGPEVRIGTFANPLDVRGADPDVLFDAGTYYLYSTSSASVGFDVWTSKDLAHWQHRGLAFRKTDKTWAQRDFWAPCVIKVGQRYLLYYNAQPRDAPADGADAHRICVAQATSPLGPFTDLAAPIWDPGGMVIDAQVFIDRDGKGYLYYSTGSVWGVALDPSLTKIVGTPVLCIQPSQAWEDGWNEGPILARHKDKYIMFYSGPGYDRSDYSVGYALADKPLGPWIKPLGTSILTHTPSVSGPGHNGLTTSPDGREMFIVYHTHQQLTGGAPRQIAVDRMRLLDDPTFGVRVEVDGPTLLPQKIPSGATGKLAAASDEFDARELNRDRWTVVNEDPTTWTLDAGKLYIHTQDGDIWQKRFDLRNLFLQTPAPGDFEIVTKVDFRVRENYDQVFLIVWQDHNNFVRISNSYIGGRKWQVARELEGVVYRHEAPNTIGDIVWMKITKRGRTYQCSASVNGQTWWPVGPPLAADFTEVQVGIGAACPGNGRREKAAFEFFRVNAGGVLMGPTLGQPSLGQPSPRR